MRKGDLIEALKPFNDDDHLQIGDWAISYVPKITVICGKTQEYMPYYCVLPPNHSGDCWCACKDVDFEPDEN